MSAERVGQGEVCNLQCWAEISWLLLDLAVESSWLLLGPLFLAVKFFLGLYVLTLAERHDSKLESLLTLWGPSFLLLKVIFTLYILNIPQFLFCWVVRLKTAPRGNFSHT